MHNIKENIPDTSAIMDRFISTLTPEYERYLDGHTITADIDSYFRSSTRIGSDLLYFI